MDVLGVEISELSFLGGLVLGLASALHCAAMCGGIATSIALLFQPKTAGERVRILLGAQAGKLVAYALAGGLLGAFGSELYTLMDRAVAYRLLQWAGAVALVAVGLLHAGLLPAPVLLDRAVVRMSAWFARVLAPLQGSFAGPFVCGLTWGIVPCPMVYAALFTAMLTGSALGGIVVMAGFGLGTIPAVTATAMGLGGLVRLESKGIARVAIGLLIAALGASTVIPGSPTEALFCAPEMRSE